MEVLSEFVYETVFKTLDKIGLIAIPLKSSYVTALFDESLDLAIGTM